MKDRDTLRAEALTELRQSEELVSALRNMEDELREIDAGIAAFTSERRKRKEILRRERLACSYAVLRSRLGRCRRALDALPPRARLLLEQMYCYQAPVLSIMDELHVEKTTFYRLHGEAVAAYVRALYGEEV